MKKRIMLGFFVLIALGICGTALADDLDPGRALIKAGKLEEAAAFFNTYATEHSRDKKLAPEALAMTGRILDQLADRLTGDAEKKCYWGRNRERDPSCMRDAAAKLNARFGKGSFAYDHDILFIAYTGSHYQKILKKYSKSPYANEAQFAMLLRNLEGHPDTVLPRIKKFLSQHPSGEWHRRGLLLWARVQEDIWYIHKKWSWVLYNDQISPDDLIIRAEPYRQEALRTYKKLMKSKGTFDGKAAASEYKTLSAQRDDGNVYSIVNDANPRTLSAWGISIE